MSAIGVREYVVLTGEDRDRVLRNLLGLRLFITLLGIGGAVIFAVAAGYRSDLVLGTLIAGVALLFTAAQQTSPCRSSGSLRLGLVSALDFARQAAFVALVVALVAVGAGLPSVPRRAASGRRARPGRDDSVRRGLVPLWPSFELREWGRVLRLTVAYAAVTAVGTIYVSITVILISLVGSGRETGYYGASFRIISVVAVLPLLLVGIGLSAARTRRGRRRRAPPVRKAAAVRGLAHRGRMGRPEPCSLGASFAIDVIAARKFDPSVGVLQIQAWMLIGTFLAVAMGFVLLSLRRHTALLVANGLALATSVALTLALVPGHGAKGAAVAAVTGESTLALLYAVTLFRGAWGEPWSRVFPAVFAAIGLSLALLLVPGLRSTSSGARRYGRLLRDARRDEVDSSGARGGAAGLARRWLSGRCGWASEPRFPRGGSRRSRPLRARAPSGVARLRAGGGGDRVREQRRAGGALRAAVVRRSRLGALARWDRGQGPPRGADDGGAGQCGAPASRRPSQPREHRPLVTPVRGAGGDAARPDLAAPGGGFGAGAAARDFFTLSGLPAQRRSCADHLGIGEARIESSLGLDPPRSR